MMYVALLPMAALLRRELLRHLRRIRVLAAVVLLGLCMLRVVWIWWPLDALQRVELIQLSSDFSFALAAVYAGAALLVLPGYSAMCIRSEHDGDTYELMYLTLLTPRAIVIGNLANVFGLFFLAVLATLPLAALPFVMTPLPWWSAALSAIVILLAGLLSTATGVFASALRRRTADTIGTAYGYALGSVVPSFFISMLFSTAFRNSFVGMFFCIPMLLAFTVTCIRSSVKRMEQYSFERVREEPFDKEFTLRERWLQHVSRRPRSVYPDGRNPVFVREFGDALHRAQINRGSLMATVILSIVLFAWTFTMVATGNFSPGAFGRETPAENLQWYFVTTMLIAACTVPGISTPAWTNDRNSEMEEALDLTLLTRRERFLGRACAAAALPFIVTTCWGFGFCPVLVNATKSTNATAIALIGGVALFATLFNLLALGRRIARTQLSTPAAVVLVHLIAIAYIGMPYMAVPGGNEVATPAQLGITAISPMAALICAVHSVRHQPAIGLYAYLGMFVALQVLFFAILAWGDVRPEWKTRKVIQ